MPFSRPQCQETPAGRLYSEFLPTPGGQGQGKVCSHDSLGSSVEMTTTLQEMPGLQQKTLGPGLVHCIFWPSKEAL